LYREDIVLIIERAAPNHYKTVNIILRPHLLDSCRQEAKEEQKPSEQCG
jgi:hypothetical protein